MAKIVVDTPTREGLGFQDYADALVNIIVDSGSPFTIGILGEWGVGKTSLMKTMFEKLKAKHEKNVIPIWFNAWRCEREKVFAIIPLLQLLVSEIKDKKLRKAFIEILKSLQLKFSLPGGAELSAGGVSQNQFGEDLYYAELDAIETSLKETDKKIVVFIDDLDRCAPDKILEVLESTKVFLDVKNFVYVLGLNSEVVVKAIDQKYKDMGINGEDYLEKIVQIPFRIPDWNVSDRGEFLTDLIDKEIDSAYQETFREYKDIIKEVIERTPRQLKRFINTYICEQEVFQGKKLDQTNHLILTILKFKWYDFYQKLFDERYRQNLKEIFDDENKLREELKLKESLIDFINSSKARKTLEKIIAMSDTQLSEYRRAGMIMPQKISEPATSREKLIELLRAGRVSEFNDLRRREGIKEPDLSRANFRWADLRGADLAGADLIRAVLSGAVLSGANLSGANLSGANLRKANLFGANLHRAVLIEAVLLWANLNGANLSGAYLLGGIILVEGPNYQEAKVSDANFEDALINDSGFLEYLKKNGAKNVPDEVSTKDKFINEMKKRGLDIEGIEQSFKE
jgi:uncharacterized protein YjbI with pentapeptide repeats